MVAKIKNLNIIKSCIIFAAAIIFRLLYPTTLSFSADIYEWVPVITLFMLWTYGIVKKIYINRKYTKLEYFGFGLFSFFSTLSYIYGRGLSLHDTNVYMGIYLAIGLIINFILAQYGYQLIERFMKNSKSKPIKNRFIANQIRSNNFLFYFLFLFVIYLLFLIINYPGVLMFDPEIQIMQIYKIPNITTNQVNLIDPDQFITTHHPFIHTLLIKLFLYIGELVGSLDVGFFLYSLFQITVMALSIAYLLTYIHKYFSEKGMLRWLLIFSLNPIVLMYSSLMTKDTIFAVLFALFGIKFFEYIKDNSIIQNKKWVASFIIITLLCSLFRNNFFYAVLITFIVLVIIKKDKKLIKTAAIYLCLYFAYTSVLVPSLGVTKGSIREVISVPFQQTANYAKYYDVTEKEKEAISKILDFETVEEYEMPEVSNIVKNTYNKNATTEDLINYFTTWFKMFFKHPLAYFDAYFNQFYGYFSTKSYYSASYGLQPNIAAREELNNCGIAFSEELPFMTAKELYNIFLILSSLTPGLYLITNSGIYIWLIIAAIAFLFKERKKKYILFYLPFILYFLTLLLSPANASIEYRYMFPYLMSLPILLAPVKEVLRKKIKRNNYE